METTSRAIIEEIMDLYSTGAWPETQMQLNNIVAQVV